MLKRSIQRSIPQQTLDPTRRRLIRRGDARSSLSLLPNVFLFLYIPLSLSLAVLPHFLTLSLHGTSRLSLLSPTSSTSPTTVKGRSFFLTKEIGVYFFKATKALAFPSTRIFKTKKKMAFKATLRSLMGSLVQRSWNVAPPALILPEFQNTQKNSIPTIPFGASMQLMAVPKKKVSPHKKGIRNGPKALKPIPVIIRCKSCGRVKLPHFYCCSGDRGSTERNNSNS